ncbi:MAG: hypothetical protein KDC23_02065 [Actinobacteria bacterium]|nr:hypothetical protein [Actinomycetota bacterium]
MDELTASHRGFSAALRNVALDLEAGVDPEHLIEVIRTREANSSTDAIGRTAPD